MKYRNLFLDLDDTLWAFSQNAYDTLEKICDKYRLGRYFDSFSRFYSLYQKRNTELWVKYGSGEVTKEELNRQRFLYSSKAVGVNDGMFAKCYSDDFFLIVPTERRLVSYMEEMLSYLAPKYNLYILSNGFRELQSYRMRSTGIDTYFDKIVLSGDLGVMKPWPEISHSALLATQSELRESLMIGDSWDADIVGAHGAGVHQTYYNAPGRTDFPFRPTYSVTDLKELVELL